MILIAITCGILISSGSFAWGYYLSGYPSVVHWVIAFGFFWLIAQWQRWRWVFTLAVFASLLLAIFGIWFNFVVGWMCSGVAFALFAWDLSEFRERTRVLPAREDSSGMIRRRILRLSLLILFVLAVATLMMLLRGQLTGDWKNFLLGILGLCLIQGFAWLKRS